MLAGTGAGAGRLRVASNPTTDVPTPMAASSPRLGEPRVEFSSATMAPLAAAVARKATPSGRQLRGGTSVSGNSSYPGSAVRCAAVSATPARTRTAIDAAYESRPDDA